MDCLELTEENTEVLTPGRRAKLRRDRERALLSPVRKTLLHSELRGDALVQATVRRCTALFECAADPLWATVEVLEFIGPLRGFDLGAFLNRMPALRELTLSHCELPEVPVPAVVELKVDEWEPLGERFPNLRRFEVHRVREPRPFWDFVRGRQLERVKVRSLTWEGDVLRVEDSWIEEPLLELMWLGPRIKRLVIPEDHHFGADSGWRLGQLFARARAMGAEVVLEASPEPAAPRHH